MGAAQDSEVGERRILRLAKGCDPRSLKLTSEEGFLLSRVDGATPWRLLCEIGGMEPEEADMCLESWLGAGYLEVSGVAPEPPPAREPPRSRSDQGPTNVKLAGAPASPPAIDEGLISDDLEIGVDVQRQILEFEASLERPYHQLLDVAEDADAKEIKKAYFKLSKEYHPDRYFKRNIAGYEARLERIFKKVLEAYEIFSDPRMRVEVARAEAQSAPSGAAPGGQPLSKLERLRQRMPFKIPKHLIEERQLKAREFYYAAQQSEHAGNLVEAASSLRIAICFDSSNRDYRAALVDMQARSAEIRATKLLEECGASYTTDADALRGVLKLLEDVLLYRPHHPALNHRAAHVALMLDEVKKAREYAETALEHSPDVAAHHTIVGMVHRAAGEFGHAKKKFDSAIAIDPNDVEARKELATLRLGRRTPVQEG